MIALINSALSAFCWGTEIWPRVKWSICCCVRSYSKECYAWELWVRIPYQRQFSVSLCRHQSAQNTGCGSRAIARISPGSLLMSNVWKATIAVSYCGMGSMKFKRRIITIISCLLTSFPSFLHPFRTFVRSSVSVLSSKLHRCPSDGIFPNKGLTDE